MYLVSSSHCMPNLLEVKTPCDNKWLQSPCHLKWLWFWGLLSFKSKKPEHPNQSHPNLTLYLEQKYIIIIKRGQSGGKMASVMDGPLAAISPSWHAGEIAANGPSVTDAIFDPWLRYLYSIKIYYHYDTKIFKSPPFQGPQRTLRRSP